MTHYKKEYNVINYNIKILIILVLLFLIPLTAFSQEGDFDDFTFEFTPAFSIGAVVLEGSEYIEFYGLFDFLIWEVNLGVQLDLQFTTDAKLRTQNWDSLEDILTKIAYVNYKEKGDKPFYLRYGSILSYTMGHGTIMSAFKNTNHEPVFFRRGLIMDLDLGVAGAETIISNVITAPIAGMRIFGRPLSFLDDSISDVIRGLEFGATYISDTGPDEIIAKVGEENERITIDAVLGAMSIIGFDVGTILLNDPRTLTMQFYMDFNIIPDLGSGFHFGGYGSIAEEDVDIQYKLEGVVVFNKYVGSYFNSRYYIQRGTKYTQINDAFNEGNRFGVNLILAKVFAQSDERYIRFAFGGSEIIGDNFGGEVEFNFIMYGLIPRINMSFSYLAYNVWKWGHLIKFDNDKAYSFKLGYQVEGALVTAEFAKYSVYDQSLMQFIWSNTFTIKVEVIF